MTSFQIPNREDHRALRTAFGGFPTGVALAACRSSEGAPVAVTINSFVSVSLDPPMISFALGRSAYCLEAFRGCSQFSIHVLNSSQLELSRLFSRPRTAKWEGIGYRDNGTGHIVLDNFAAAFLCNRQIVQIVGDHVMFFGRVLEFSSNIDATPLAFSHGRYAVIRGLQSDWTGSVPSDWVNAPGPVCWG